MLDFPRLVRIALPVAVLLVGFVVPSLPAAASPRVQPLADAGQVKVLTFNMCAVHCNGGVNSGAFIDNVVATIEQEKPNAVLLQELCQSEFTTIYQTLYNDGIWVMTGSPDTTEAHGCAEPGNPFGDAVLLHGNVKPTVAGRALPYPHGKPGHREVRKVLCVRVDGSFPRETEVCTVHAGLAFQIGAKHQAKQIKVAYNFARKVDPQHPLIFAGDFNVVPSANALDPVYAKGGGGASGAMEEVDACAGKHGRAHHSKTCNRTTHDAYPQVKHRTKSDYIFGSAKSFKDESAQVVNSSYSDHDMLIGSLFLCSTGSC